MRIIISLLLICSLGCKHDEIVLSAEQSFLKKALIANGGYENWKSMQELSFTKKTRMFFPDSTIEMESLQKQTFRNSPRFYAEILYLNDSLERRIVQDEDNILYFENGLEIKDAEKVRRAALNIQIAYYVIALPFKLMDEGVNLRSVKDENLLDGRTVKSLNVIHDSNPDQQWWLYFDQSTSEMCGYLIDHDKRFSYILNDSVTTIVGFQMPLKRRSIALDSLRKNPYLRADYVYSNIILN